MQPRMDYEDILDLCQDTSLLSDAKQLLDFIYADETIPSFEDFSKAFDKCKRRKKLDIPMSLEDSTLMKFTYYYMSLFLYTGAHIKARSLMQDCSLEEARFPSGIMKGMGHWKTAANEQDNRSHLRLVK